MLSWNTAGSSQNDLLKTTRGRGKKNTEEARNGSKGIRQQLFVMQIREHAEVMLDGIQGVAKSGISRHPMQT